MTPLPANPFLPDPPPFELDVEQFMAALEEPAEEWLPLDLAELVEILTRY